jgi:hypothetical protein
VKVGKNAGRWFGPGGRGRRAAAHRAGRREVWRLLGSYARHNYDLFQLAAQPEVMAMLQSAEYAVIKADYDQISRAHFSNSYFCPGEMSFALRAVSQAYFCRKKCPANIASMPDE